MFPSPSLLRTAAQKFHTILPKQSRTWAILLCCWATALWFLSGGAPAVDGPEIPHLDKVLHFTYFGIGGSLLAGYLSLVKPTLNVSKVILCSWLMGAIIGGLDEYRQSFNPARTGNDPYDWTADQLGAIAGAILCLWIFRTARKLS